MKKKKNTLLWSLVHPQFDGVSYLFGTMHVSDERAFRYVDIVKEKIDNCDAFALEFNLDAAALGITNEAMNLPAGTTLESLIPAKKFEKINKRFEGLTGYDLRMFNQSIPMQITNMMAGIVLSNDRLKSLDETLFQYAKEQDKLLLGIETFEEQLNILGKIPIENQLKSMLKVFKNFPKFRKQVIKMTQLYESGNITQLYKSTKKSIGGERQLLLYDRNEIMADRVSKMINEQTVVGAIGAAHLSGKKGVLRLLKRKGIQVKPVKTQLG
ncbi:MAG: TraB/GumN family protein [Bacteroidota bacterium]